MEGFLYLLPSVLWVQVDDDFPEPKVELYNQGYEHEMRFQFPEHLLLMGESHSQGLTPSLGGESS